MGGLVGPKGRYLSACPHCLSISLFSVALFLQYEMCRAGKLLRTTSSFDVRGERELEYMFDVASAKLLRS